MQRSPTSMQRMSAVHLSVLDFSTALAVCCVVNASLISRKRAELTQRIVEE
jgi:hypothetical protein